MQRVDNAIREALADSLGLLAFKARTGQMTDEDVALIARAIREGGGIRATVRDLAGYYGQSENNVRHIINRNLMPAPERRVYHDFSAFRKRIPSSWTKSHGKPGD